jgi:hypothetical protein
MIGSMKTALPALLLSFGTALAQEPPPPMVAEPAPTGPVILPNMLSTNAGVVADINFDYIDIDGLDATLLALRAHVQYISPAGAGGYVMVPAGYFSIDDDGIGAGGDDDFQLGNVEVGGLYALRSSPTLDILLRGGVSIDTQDSVTDDVGINVIAHFLPRPTDAFTSGGFNSTWARGQAQFTNTSQNIRFGCLVGVDVPVAGELADDGDLDALVNIALVAGYQDAKFGLGAGFTLIQTVSDGDDDDIKGIQLQGNMAINPMTRAYLGIGLSLDGDEFLDGTAFGLGVRAAL